MAIKSIEKRKKQKLLLLVAIIIIITAFLLLYFFLWQESPTSQETEIMPSRQTRESIILENKLMKTELDFSFLVEKILPFLESHGDLPVEVGEVGRNNPFVAY